jgi:hypothetical protein
MKQQSGILEHFEVYKQCEQLVPGFPRIAVDPPIWQGEKPLTHPRGPQLKSQALKTWSHDILLL